MQNAVITQPNRVQIQDLPIPEPGPSEILIRVKASGICGTDLHIYRGEYLGSYPIVPGHEFAGQVVATGSLTTRIHPGDRVAIEPNIACDNCPDCLNNRQNFCQNWQAVGVTRPGGMAEYVLAPEKAVFSIGDLPFEVGAFMEPLSCVLHGIQRAEIELADRVVIFGAGPIGAMMLQAARLQGAARLTILENNPTRAEFIASFQPDQIVRQVDELTPNGYDVVIDATGVPALMGQSIHYARPGGSVLLFGVPPSGSTLQLDAFQVFRKGIKILSSYTSVRNSLQAIELLQNGRIQVAPLISHRLPLVEFERGLEILETRQVGVKKVMIFPEALA